MYSWEHGRELASMSSGGTTWSFTYDANGMRTARSDGTTEYTYVYNGGQLSRMTIGPAIGATTENTITLDFTYDASGTPLSVVYNGTYYYYVTDLQGDVVAIVDTAGVKVVEYLYDAWGRLLETNESLASTLGVHNPLRYRGYVYDPESGLYYLQSRYYNPSLGRFINADALVSTGHGILGNNMFAYCLNNPITYYDPAGACGQCITSKLNNQFSLANAECGGCSGGNPSIGAGVVVVQIFNKMSEAIAELVKTAVSTLDATTKQRTQHVYVLTDPQCDNLVKYVGRTNDPARRLREHQNDPRHPERAGYMMHVFASGLTLDEARVVEQIVISAFTLAHLDNARREIAVGNINAYQQYMSAANAIFVGATEDGLLSLIGG